jgi:UDP-galactopyranose mutase
LSGATPKETTDVHVKNLIIGAGPTGLGAARRLAELDENDFLVLERSGHAGGLAASFRDGAGFTWDIGGHVVFSHYEYFDRLVEDVLGDEFLEHERIARVRMAGGWVDYPFQNNLRQLPPELAWQCVRGLLPENRPQAKPRNFGQWIDHVFGPGIARLFMRPYNFKVWATPPEEMAFDWIGERVSVVELAGVLENLVLGRADAAWGPNRTFRFPLAGGTGEIFRRMADRLGGRVRYNETAWKIDAAKKLLLTREGGTYTYDNLLSTGPLDKLVLELLDACGGELRNAARALAHNSVYVAGVGVDGLRNDPTCWMYFPEDAAPFYRLTNFHNYSPRNAGRPGASRALMAETSFSEHKPEDTAKLMDKTIDGLVNTTMMHGEERAKVLSTWETTVEYGYPVPTLERDAALSVLQPWLAARNIFSRGRFGGWKYEVANMDHSVMQGVEWAERMVLGTAERTYTVEEHERCNNVFRAA